MEAAASFCASLKSYRRRRRYQRLDNVVTDKENEKISMLEGTHSRSWKIRVMPKLRPKVKFSIKHLKKFGDAYVDMMLSFAGHVAQLNNGNVYLFKMIPKAPQFSD